MKFCKPFWKKHSWLRYDELIEQLFVGGYCAWHVCKICKKVDFIKCGLNSPQKPGWKEHKNQINKYMGLEQKEYK